VSGIVLGRIAVAPRQAHMEVIHSFKDERSTERRSSLDLMQGVARRT
jgi:hypothetical protein